MGGTRELLDKHVEARVKEYEERDKKSLQEMLTDSRSSRVLGNIIEDDDLRERVIKNEITESDLAPLGDARKAALEVMRKTDSVIGFLRTEGNLQHMAATHEGFREFYGVIGKDAALKLLDETYFDDLHQNNRAAFNRLVASVDASNRLNSAIDSLDQQIEDISSRFVVSKESIEQIIGETDPRKRENKIKDLASGISKFRLDVKSSMHTHLGKARSSFNSLAEKNSQNAKKVGAMLNSIVSLDADLRQKLVEELRNPADKEPDEPTIEEMRKAIEDAPNAWQKFKESTYKKSVPNGTPANIENYWNTLLTSTDPQKTQELAAYREEFAKANPKMFPPQTSRKSWLRRAFEAILEDVTAK